MSRSLYAAPIVLLFFIVSAFALEAESQRLAVSVNNVEHQFDIDIPDGWSLAADQSRNSRTLVNVRVGENKRPTAIVRIFVEPRLDHQDALKQIREQSVNIAASDKKLLRVGGWPAMQITTQQEAPMPDNAPLVDERVTLQVRTLIAAGDSLIIIAGSLPMSADALLHRQMKATSSSLRFEGIGQPKDIEQDLKLLGTPIESSSFRSPAPVSDQSPEHVMLDTTPVEIGAEVGANDRINTSGRGELEIAVSPDGLNVVVALQSRRWVSSNDGGATFPNFGRVGAGNGDPSIAWGQSGKFYMAFIDTANCSSGYLNPVPVPEMDGLPGTDPTPNGLDCTGMARSDDNGVTFNTNTVNPAAVCIGRASAGNPPLPGECFPDQEHIAADRWNAGDTADDDQVYSTWRNFRVGGQDAALVCSSDSGVTWSTPFDIGTPEVFPRITVGQDGFVYVASYSGGSYRLYKFTSCVNGLNAVAGFPVTVGSRDPYQCPFAGHDRCDQNPTSQTVVVDGTDPNHIYYAYVDDIGDGSTGNSNIIVRDSLDGGLTWPAIGRIARANENVNARRIMPWLCSTGGDAVVTWFEQRGALPTDATDFYGARVGLNDLGDLEPKEEFIVSEVSDNWCDTGWDSATRWGNTSNQLSNASESCPNQPQLAGQCGDGNNGTPDSGIRCDFSDDQNGGTTTNCPQPGPSGNNEFCLVGGGSPKYGDYNGNACTGGRLYAAWASAMAPDGLPAPDTATNSGVLFDAINLDNLGVPIITVPGSVHFGDVCSGDTSYQPLQVCNTGSANLQVDVITSDNPDFAVTIPSSGYPVTISPDFCFPFEVVHTPNGGADTAILTIPNDDPDRSSIEVAVDATIGEQNLVTVMDGGFGDVCLDDQSSQQLTLLNDGTCPLTVNAVSIINDPEGEFGFATVMSTPFVLQAGESVSGDVEFSPVNDFGAATAQIEIDSDDPDTPNKVLDVDGNSPPGDINLAIANSGDFGAMCKGGHSDLDLTLFNQGACDLTISDISLIPAGGSFELPADLTFPLVLSHDADFTVPVRYAPDMCSDDPEQSSIVVSSDDPDEMQVNVDISGESPCPNLVIDPDGIGGLFAFPTTVADSTGSLGCYNDRSVTLRNNGACPLTISDISAAGLGDPLDFAVISPLAFPIILPSGEETLGVTVRFTPQSDDDPLAPSEVLGLLTINSDDPDGSNTGDLCGESAAQSGIRVLAADVSSGIPIPVDSVDRITISSKGKKTPSPVNFTFTDVDWQQADICGETITWHVDQETLPNAQTTGNNPKSSYQVTAKEGNLQDAQSFNLNQCDLLEFQLQLSDSSSPSCLLLPKGAACDNAGQCCSGKCTGKSGSKSCK